MVESWLRWLSWILTSSLCLDSNPSTLRTRLEFETFEMCSRHLTTHSDVTYFSNSYRSSLDRSKTLLSAQTLSWACLISVGVLQTFLRYWFISSDLSVTEGKKELSWENSDSSSNFDHTVVAVKYGSAEGVWNSPSVVGIQYLGLFLAKPVTEKYFFRIPPHDQIFGGFTHRGQWSQ